MPRKSYKPEEIVAKLRQVDVLTSQGKNVAEAIRSVGTSEVTYYRCVVGIRHRLCRYGDRVVGLVPATANGRRHSAHREIPGVAADTDRADLQQSRALR